MPREEMESVWGGEMSCVHMQSYLPWRNYVDMFWIS